MRTQESSNTGGYQLGQSLRALWWLAGGRSCGVLLGFLTTVLLARELGAASYGIFSVITTVFGYLILVGEVGLRTVMIAETARSGGSRRLLTCYLTTRITFSAVVFIAATLVLYGFYDKYIIPATILFCSLIIMPLCSDWLLIVKEDYLQASLSIVSRWIAFCLLVIILFGFSAVTLQSACIAFFFSWLAAALFSLWLARGELKILVGLQGKNDVTMQSLLSLGTPVLFGQLFAQCMQTADVLWLGLVQTPVAVGNYHISNSLITALLLAANALSQVMLSRYAVADMHSKETQKLFQTDITLLVLSAGVLCLLLAICRPVITLIFGSEYSSVVDLVIYFFPYVLSYHIFIAVFSVLVAQQKQFELVRALPKVILLLCLLYGSVGFMGDLALVALSKGIIVSLTVVILLYKVKKDWGPFYIKTCLIPLIVSLVGTAILATL